MIEIFTIYYTKNNTLVTVTIEVTGLLKIKNSNVCNYHLIYQKNKNKKSSEFKFTYLIDIQNEIKQLFLLWI